MIVEPNLDKSELKDEMATLICETRSLVETHGDGRHTYDSSIKKKYEHAEVYQAVLRSLNQDHLTLLPHYYANGRLLPDDKVHRPEKQQARYDEKKGFSTENLTAALNEGRIFSRAVVCPSYYRHKVSSTGSQYAPETSAGVEVRKVTRREGKATRTKKADSTKKHGNPQRSVSMLGSGIATFSPVGFLRINPPMNIIHSGQYCNVATGFGKQISLNNMQSYEKRHALVFDEKSPKATDHTSAMHKTIKEIQDVQKMGGRHPGFNEFLMEYKNATGETLPLIEYSGSHNIVKRWETPSPDKIVEMWVQMCSDFMEPYYNTLNQSVISSMDLDTIKMKAMYGNINVPDEHKKNFVNCSPADSNYPPELRAKINEAILKRKKELEMKIPNEMARIKQCWLNPQENILTDRKLCQGLIANPDFLEIPEIKTSLTKTINNLIDNINRGENQPLSEKASLLSPLVSALELSKIAKLNDVEKEIAQVAIRVIDKILSQANPATNLGEIISYAKALNCHDLFRDKIAFLAINNVIYTKKVSSTNLKAVLEASEKAVILQDTQGNNPLHKLSESENAGLLLVLLSKSSPADLEIALEQKNKDGHVPEYKLNLIELAEFVQAPSAINIPDDMSKQWNQFLEKAKLTVSGSFGSKIAEMQKILATPSIKQTQAQIFLKLADNDVGEAKVFAKASVVHSEVTPKVGTKVESNENNTQKETDKKRSVESHLYTETEPQTLKPR